MLLAFACPFPGCGRRFSVMSNMRRHSRVHAQPRLNEPAALPEGLQDAEGEPDPDVDVYEMESMELERPPLTSATATSSSGPSTGSRSSLRRGGSSSTSRRSSTRGTSRPSTSTHASSGTSQLQIPAPRPIQPAPPPPSSRHPSVLLPVLPESLSATAQRLYVASQPQTPVRPPLRVTRSSAAKRPRDEDEDGEDSSPGRSNKRSKDDDR